MVSSGGSQLDPEPPVEFSGELRHELGSTVRHYIAGQAVVLPDMLNEQTGRPSCSDGHEGGYEVGSFSAVLYTPPPVRSESDRTHWTLIRFRAVQAQSELSPIRIRAQSDQSPSSVRAQSEYKIINTRAGFEPMTSLFKVT